jgi:fatty-acyl-CoA synthase
LFTQKDGAFYNYAAAATVRRLYELKLTIPCIDTLCDCADISAKEKSLDEINECIKIATNLHIPNVRIKAIGEGIDKEDAIKSVMEILSLVVPKAEANNISLLIETTGIFCDTAALREVLIDFASDSLGALWDMCSPYFNNGEQPEATITNLGAYVRHVHIKDAQRIKSSTEFCLMGEGELPIGDMMAALRSVNYDGFISLEWHPD